MGLRLHAVYGTNGNFSEKVISKQFIPNVLLPHKIEHGLPIILFLKIKIIFFVIIVSGYVFLI